MGIATYSFDGIAGNTLASIFLVGRNAFLTRGLSRGYDVEASVTHLDDVLPTGTTFCLGGLGSGFSSSLYFRI